MSTVVRVENLSKIYKLGLIGSNTLAADFADAFARIRGRQNPAKKVDAGNEDNSFHIALQDVSFDVQKGEVLGIIGKNGAGKSTLLKILSSITSPTTGTIKMKGRVASLLEVGTGFHPELSGRENIYLNGAILGMLRSEVTSKFDEIVDFSGVAKFIDTPVKRYSSGMYVRLAFAVAAHLEPEILIVDEVLSVGDAEFQKKSIGKMKDVAANQGRTVLFVSHTVKALQALCHNGLLLQKGKIVKTGQIKDVTNYYLGGESDGEIRNSVWTKENAPTAGGVFLLEAKIKNLELITSEDEVAMEFILHFDVEKKFHLNLHLFNNNEEHIFQCMTDILEYKPGSYKIDFVIPANLINHGGYQVHLNFIENGSKNILTILKVLSFDVKEPPTKDLIWYEKWPGIIRPTIFSQVTKVLTLRD